MKKRGLECQIECFMNGNKRFERHYKDGIIHRDSGPAYIEWTICGEKCYEAYYLDGRRHSERGPAIIYYSCGVVCSEHFYVDNLLVSIEYFISHGYKVNKCKKCNKTYFTKEKK